MTHQQEKRIYIEVSLMDTAMALMGHMAQNYSC